MKDIDRPELSSVFYSATEYKRFHGNIFVGNHVPLGKFLAELEDKFSDPDKDFIPVRVTTGLELSTLTGISGSLNQMVFTDGLIEESVYAPEGSDRQYVGLRVAKPGTYVASVNEEETQGRYVPSRFHIQTPLKAPEFRQMVSELPVNLQNIKFFCEFWGDR